LNSDESLDAVAAICGGGVTVAAAATPSGASAAVAAAGSGSPSRRPRSSAVNSDLHHLRHSGDSGDSGVSSPGPPSSEASEQKHSGEEEEEEEDADEEDDRGSDNLSYMDRVVMEVVESETVYVRDLQQVVEVMRTFDYSVFVASAASKNKRNFFVSSFVFHTMYNNNRNHRHNNNYYAKGWLGWVGTG
jgi:hypothetical protein